jgi:hypothetical protein
MIYFPSTVQDLKTHRYMRTEELTELYLPKKKSPTQSLYIPIYKDVWPPLECPSQDDG